MENKEHPFVTYLETLKEDKAALAALRLGLGQPPGTVPAMYPYVIRYLPNDAYNGSWKEQTYYLIASLYGLHPESIGVGNLGSHFYHAIEDPNHMEALERRFTALLTANPQDFHFYLRQAISFLSSKEVPINWHQLMRDVLYLENFTSSIQKRWANQFWSPMKKTETQQQPTS